MSGTSSFTRCWFSSNLCVGHDSESGSSGSGGTVSIVNGDIIDCTFRFNSAVSFGGALAAIGQVAIQNCLFDANTAGRGGAVYSTAHLSIKNSTLKYCVASDHGAASYTLGDTLVSDTLAMSFDPSASNAVVFHESTNTPSLLVLRGTSFQDVGMLFVASSQPDTIIVVNCDGVNATDIPLTSLFTCAYSEMWNYCSPEHCFDVTVGIEV